MLMLEIAVAVGALLVLGLVLSACVCGCRNNHQKSELVGTAGVVKLRFDEETPESPAPTTPASVKRASAQNSQRSLPEIPQPVGRHDSADTASDLIYATVNIDGGGTKAVPTPSTSRDHSYEHAYAKVQNENHTHVETAAEPTTSAEVVVVEPEAPSQAGLESVVISAGGAISGQLPSSEELPYMTPPSPLPHPPPPPPDPPTPRPHHQQHFSGDSTDSAKGYTSISVREPLSNIRAILTTNKMQQHYATVSDDSDEMYAAIDDPSIGGGSDTYAQIAPQPPHLPQPLQPPAPDHRVEPRQPRTEARGSQERDARNVLLPSDAATSSRRSAPPDVAAVVSNHSRQASSSSCSNSVGTLGSPKPEKRQANSPLPPPPAAPTPDVKPERRRQESPLTHTNMSRQQRISSTGDLHFSHDKHRRSLNEKHQRNNSCVSSSDFYGCNYPVEKHRFSSGDLIRPLVAKELNFDIDKPTENKRLDNLYNSIEGPSCSDYSSAEANISLPDRTTESPSRNVEEMYAKVMKKGKKLQLNDEHKSARKLTYTNECTATDTANSAHRFSNEDPGYETIDRKRSVNHGYETITEKVRKVSQNQDPGYETVRDINKIGNNGNFSNNNLLNKISDINQDSGPNSMLSSDPGYEHISKANSCPSDSDPNYEVLRNEPPTPPYATIAPNYNMPTYSVINKNRSNNNDDAITEPNYESMPHDPIYTTGSESDPNYESVRPKDPNYESVSSRDPNYESLRLKKDPNYESVRSKDRYDVSMSKNPYETVMTNDPNYETVTPKDPNYESVKYMDVSKEPPYARVAGDTDDVDKDLHRSDSAAGYERIKPITTKNSINGEGGTVEDYFQV